MEPDQFIKNLKRWSLVCPKGAKRVEGLNCKTVNYCHTITGALNLVSLEQNQQRYLHSQVDPVEEAVQWFSKLNIKNINIIFVWEIGLGYCYKAAKDWLRQDPNHYLVFFEQNPEVLHRFLSSPHAHEMLHDPQVAIYLIDPKTSLIEIHEYCRIYSLYNNIISSLDESTPSFFEFKKKLGYLISFNRSDLIEYSNHGSVVLKNAFKNYLELPRAYLGNRLIGKFKNIPAIICGAGPSLNLNIDILGTLKDKAIIFAGGTGVSILNARGIMPHFAVGIDPNPAQITRLIMNQAFEVPFIYRSRMLYTAMEMVHGDRLFVTGSPGYNTAKWMDTELGIVEDEIDEGANVLNFSLAFAHAMGCNPIITVGVDLAYSGGNSYAAGVASHPIHATRSLRTRGQDEELIYQRDIYGNVVPTLWKWMNEALWYSNFAHKHPEITIINATEGGLGFYGVSNLSLSHVRDVYLTKSRDLSTLIYGEIQNSELPKQVTNERIKEIFKTLIESLRTCVQHIERIIGDIAENKLITVSPDLLEKIEILKKEPGYQAILEVFEKAYTTIHGLELQKIMLEADSITKENADKKKNAFLAMSFESLRMTAQINASNLQNLLNQHEHIESIVDAWNNPTLLEELRRSHPVPTSKNEVYKFENHYLTMVDPEMGLNFNEKYDPQSHEIERSYYENGILKSEQFYREGVLHGPSFFYSDKGKLISQTWFINGERQGKKWTCYSSGAFHSLERFLNGKEHGQQEYFYSNGDPKSFFAYNNGIMHGEVQLFYPGGVLARQLTFVMGKREGTERIWDRCGILRVEANYKEDQPVGLARIWHSNGTLIRETTYDKNSKCIENKIWDSTGKLLPPEQVEQDFFEGAAKQVSTLTNVLKSILDGVSHLSPLSNSAESGEHVGDQAVKENEDIVDDLKKLQQEMDKLSGLQQRIVAQTESDQTNKEDSWKNLPERVELEKQIDQISTQFADQLKELQKNLDKLLGPFPKDKNNH